VIDLVASTPGSCKFVMNSTNLLIAVASAFVGAVIGAAAVRYLRLRIVRDKHAEGHTESKWTSRAYDQSSELGGITGAPASLHAFAKTTLDQSLPLLDGLYSLSPDAARADLDAVRAGVRSRLTEIVDEFGHDGGPRVSHVDSLFTALLGEPPPHNSATMGGEIDALRIRFGMDRSFVYTVEDEQDLTNFRILVDYVMGLQHSWESWKLASHDKP
jgi:hypothetical protein